MDESKQKLLDASRPAYIHSRKNALRHNNHKISFRQGYVKEDKTLAVLWCKAGWVDRGPTAEFFTRAGLDYVLPVRHRGYLPWETRREISAELREVLLEIAKNCRNTNRIVSLKRFTEEVQFRGLPGIAEERFWQLLELGYIQIHTVPTSNRRGYYLSDEIPVRK
jgi:hypothetical protein